MWNSFNRKSWNYISTSQCANIPGCQNKPPRALGTFCPCLLGVPWKRSTLQKGRVPHYVTWLHCFPCKYYFIQSLVQYLDVMQHCVVQTCSRSLNTERTQSNSCCKSARNRFELGFPKYSEHYVRYELVLWVYIVDIFYHLFFHSF